MFIKRDKFLKHQGYSILEILIALTLSLLVMTTLLNIYLASKHALTLQLTLNKLENHATIASLFLKNSVKMAGYIGCAKLSDDFSVLPYHEYTYTLTNKLQSEVNGFTARSINENHSTLIKPMVNSTAIIIDNESFFKRDDVAVIYNCKHAEIFRIAKVLNYKNYRILIPKESLHYLYPTYTEVARFKISHFYFEKDKQDKFTLFFNDGFRFTNALLKNISQYHLRYMNSAVLIDFEVAIYPFKKTWFVYAATE